MKNIEIKKAILEAIAREKNYFIELVLWYGDGEYHTEEEGTPIYNSITVWKDKDYSNMLFDTEYGTKDLMENEQNLKVLRAEQKKMYEYITKHFKNITIKELNV